LTAKTYTEALLKNRSAPDDHSYSLYRVLTLKAKTYTEALLKDGSAPDSHSYSLYRALTLTAKTYMETLATCVYAIMAKLEVNWARVMFDTLVKEPSTFLSYGAFLISFENSSLT